MPSSKSTRIKRPPADIAGTRFNRATTLAQLKHYRKAKRRSASNGQHPGCEVAIGGERGEIGRQIGANDAWNDEDKPEKTAAVQSSDGTSRFDPVHRLEPGPDVRAKTKQPRYVDFRARVYSRRRVQ